jgi:hypothetical protein
MAEGDVWILEMGEKTTSANESNISDAKLIILF